jgi:hypothetical protein
MRESIPIISNCQAYPLARTLARYCPTRDFREFGVHLLGSPPDAGKIAAFVEEHKKARIIISVNLAENFGPIASVNIKQTFPDANIIRIQNLYFSGLHPDLTYIGGRGERAFGPLGDYHSKIAAAAWANGLSVDDAIEQFNYDCYAALGYLDEFAASFAEMRERALELDVEVSEELQKHVLSHDLFFTVNHPTSLTFSIKAFAIAKKLDEGTLAARFSHPFPAAVLPNLLALNNIFPVYPEIATHHGATISASYNFVGTLPGDKQATYSLREFIEGEYQCFERIGASRIAETQGIPRIAMKIKERA